MKKLAFISFFSALLVIATIAIARDYMFVPSDGTYSNTALIQTSGDGMGAELVSLLNGDRVAIYLTNGLYNGHELITGTVNSPGWTSVGSGTTFTTDGDWLRIQDASGASGTFVKQDFGSDVLDAGLLIHMDVDVTSTSGVGCPMWISSASHCLALSFTASNIIRYNCALVAQETYTPDDTDTTRHEVVITTKGDVFNMYRKHVDTGVWEHPAHDEAITTTSPIGNFIYYGGTSGVGQCDYRTDFLHFAKTGNFDELTNKDFGTRAEMYSTASPMVNTICVENPDTAVTGFTSYIETDAGGSVTYNLDYGCDGEDQTGLTASQAQAHLIANDPTSLMINAALVSDGASRVRWSGATLEGDGSGGAGGGQDIIFGM